MKLALPIIAALLSATATLAEPLPLPRPQSPGGSCPHGYFSSGSFCVPSTHAQDAVPKPSNGTCPCGMDIKRQLLLPLRQRTLKAVRPRGFPLRRRGNDAEPLRGSWQDNPIRRRRSAGCCRDCHGPHLARRSLLLVFMGMQVMRARRARKQRCTNRADAAEFSTAIAKAH